MIVFIAHWDERIGPKLEDSLLIDDEIRDLDELSIQIFMTFQTMFGDSTDVDLHSTYLTFPFKSYNHVGRILLDSVPNSEVRGGKEPFIIVVLCNDYITDDKITEFDPIINEISQNYKQLEDFSLEDHKEALLSKLNQLLEMDELQIELPESYSLTNAVSDFQLGIQYFQKKRWKTAYDIIKKSLLKFEHENQQKLLLEATYLISTILLKLGKFIGAYQSFIQLEYLADKLNHRKYFEIAQFLQGFCLFKLNRYDETISKLENISINSTQFTNKIQYFSILGQSHQYKEDYNQSIKNQEECLVVINQDPKFSTNVKLKAEIYFKLGLSYYKNAIFTYKKENFNEDSKKKFHSNLNQAISYLQTSSDFNDQIEEYQQNIQILQLIGSIYDYLGESEIQLEFYTKAFQYAEKLKDITQKLKIVAKIIQLNTNLKKYSENIKIIQQIQVDLNQYAFLDGLTIAKFHFLLGTDLLHLEQRDQALMEFLTALNHYRKLELPVIDQKETLIKILEIYKEKEDTDHLDYYKDELNNITKELMSFKPKAKSTLGVLKDIWVFNLNGLELFSFAPEMKFDPSLLGGFLSALRGFSEEISKNELNTIVMGDFRYSLYLEPNKDFFIMGRSNLREPETVVLNSLSIIYKRFYQEYSSHIINFSGDTRKFQSFKSIIPKIDLKIA
jgi:tetratricopeptide (TPR) repeat protein